MKDKKKNNKVLKIITTILTILFIWGIFFAPKDNTISEENIKTYNEFIEYVDAGTVEFVNYDIGYPLLEFKLQDSDTIYQTDNPRSDTLKQDLLEKNIAVNEVDFNESTVWDFVIDIIFLIIQYGLIFGMFFLLFKKLQGGTDEMQIQTSATNTFADVAGLEEVKESLMTTVDMLKHPQKYAEAGARISKGALLYGPPGTGKTLLAKAVAGEAGVNFLAMSGSDFDNKYVGVGADKIRKIFKKAKELAPCIVFIDEIDAIGGKRTTTDKAYERQTLNQLLSCMDGFGVNDGVFIFAATNDVSSLDAALLRPGRFDSRFAVGLPDTAKDREAIIKLYLKNKKLEESVSIESLAKQMLGCSPAAIEAIINEAAIESVKNEGIINQKNIDDAFYRQIMDGHQKKNPDRDQKEIQTVAWHEAGHALVGFLQNEEVTKISIVPTTSGAGGVTIFNQKKMGLYSKEDLENRIRTLYAGRNAEILLNGEEGITTGASNDIQEATKCIKHMVSTYGMSKYGLLNLDEIDIPTSEILQEYQAISRKMEQNSMRMLQQNKDALETLANALIEREMLDENELLEILKNVNAPIDNVEICAPIK